MNGKFKYTVPLKNCLSAASIIQLTETIGPINEKWNFWYNDYSSSNINMVVLGSDPIIGFVNDQDRT